MSRIDRSVSGAAASGRAARLHRAAWRWHFYAGLLVVPFFLIVTVTWLMMLWIAHLDGRDGERIPVTPQTHTASLNLQAAVASTALMGGETVQYISPRAEGHAAIFRVDGPGGPVMVAVDPDAAEIVSAHPRRSGWYDWADEVHGSLMLGVFGDRVIEIAASLAIMLLASGLYLWCPRGTSLRRALNPRRGTRGRALWKQLHASTGIWISATLLFFLISGLSWAGIWAAGWCRPGPPFRPSNGTRFFRTTPMPASTTARKICPGRWSRRPCLPLDRAQAGA